MWPWDGGGHHFSFLHQKWQAGWPDRGAHPPGLETCDRLGGTGRRRGCAGWHVLPLGWVRGAGDEHSVARLPPCCLPAVGAACREPQRRGARCQPRRLGTATRAARPRRTPARTLLAARRWPRRSPEGPGSARASRAPSRPCRAPCLPASQCPGPASSLSLSPPAPFLLFFPTLPVSQTAEGKAVGGAEKKGVPAVNGRQEGTGEGLGVSLVCLSGKRWVLIPLPQSLPEKFTSFPPSLRSLFCTTKEERTGTVSVPGGEHVPHGRQRSPSGWCAWERVLVPAPAAQHRGVPRPGGAGPLGLSNMN